MNFEELNQGEMQPYEAPTSPDPNGKPDFPEF